MVEPTCPRCGRQRPLSGLAGGLRICGGCHSKARALRCGRCGKVSPVARRNDGGQPICQNCWHRDPRSWKPCVKCGHERRVAAITGAGPVCQDLPTGPRPGRTSKTERNQAPNITGHHGLLALTQMEQVTQQSAAGAEESAAAAEELTAQASTLMVVHQLSCMVGSHHEIQ